MTVLSSATVYGANIGADVVYRTFGEPINTFLTERLENAGPVVDQLISDVGQDISEISEKLKEALVSWLEGYIEKPDEVSFRQIEFQKELNKALLPQDLVDIHISPMPPDFDDMIKELEDLIKNLKEDHLHKDIGENRDNGNRREREFKDWLEQQYNANDGYIIEDEVYLRDKDGNIVKDPVTGEGRRVDFVVIKDNKVIKSFEVTSPTAPKEDQMAKEARIRENGGNYMRDEETGESIAYDDNVKTEVVRIA